MARGGCPGSQGRSAGLRWRPVEDPSFKISTDTRVCTAPEPLPRPFPATIQNPHFALEKWIATWQMGKLRLQGTQHVQAELDLVPHECPALPPRSPEPGLPLLPPVPRRHALWLPLFSQSTGSMVPAWHDQRMCDVICRDQGSHPSCGPSGLRPPERAGRLSSRATQVP